MHFSVTKKERQMASSMNPKMRCVPNLTLVSRCNTDRLASVVAIRRSFNQYFTLLLIRNEGRVTPDVKGFASGCQTLPGAELAEPSGLSRCPESS